MLFRSRPRSLALVLACGAVSACFDDRGLAGTTTAGASTGAVTTTTDPGDPTGSSSTTTDPTGDPTTGGSTTTDLTTDPTGEPGLSCQEACVMDTDCRVMGANMGFACEAGRCVDPNALCAADGDCVAVASGWTTPCAAQADCPEQVCIDTGGGMGRCARAPSNAFMCSSIGQTELKMPAIEGGDALVVCANTEFVCRDSACTNPCEDSAACATTPGHPTCDTNSGACVCSTDEHCIKGELKGLSVGNDGACGCVVDADCAAVGNADVCGADGRCGCSSAAACTQKKFDGTLAVCEGA